MSVCLIPATTMLPAQTVWLSTCVPVLLRIPGYTVRRVSKLFYFVEKVMTGKLFIT